LARLFGERGVARERIALKLEAGRMADLALDRIALLRRIAERGRGGELGADGVEFAARLDFYFEHAQSGMTLDEAMGLKVKAGGRPWWVSAAQDRRDLAMREALQRFCSGSHLVLEAELRSYGRARWKRDVKLREMPPAYGGMLRELLYRAFHENESVARGRMPMSGKQLGRILPSHCNGEGKPGHEPPPYSCPATAGSITIRRTR
jgi:hypothetical protein